MASELKGTAFISGAGGGIGRACVLQLVHDGCTRILITDIQQETLDETMKLAKEVNPGLDLLVEIADISSDGVADRLVGLMARKWDRVDYALNVAGISGVQKGTTEVTTANWTRTMDVNARAVWLCERAQITQMLKQDLISTRGRPGERGSIVNVASICGIIGLPNTSDYTMSKHAVVGLVKTDATTYSSRGIRINAVCPGIIDTPMTSLVKSKESQGFVDTFCPMKRLGRPEEVADVALFLCSSRASFCSGAVINVDGGFTAF